MKGNPEGAQKLGLVSKAHAKRSIISQDMTDAWVNVFNQIKVREARYLLRAMTSLMASTGITPELEVETLTPAQIVEVADGNGRPSLRITVRNAQGKQKNGRVVCARSHDVWPASQDIPNLLAWIAANATEDYRRNNPRGYLFARPSDGLPPTKFAGVFADVLDHPGLRRDPVSGVFRTLYCCRHFYARQSLMDDVSITFLAENMGNSEAMIRKHHNHVITDLRSGQLTGVSGLSNGTNVFTRCRTNLTRGRQTATHSEGDARRLTAMRSSSPTQGRFLRAGPRDIAGSSCVAWSPIPDEADRRAGCRTFQGADAIRNRSSNLTDPSRVPE